MSPSTRARIGEILATCKTLDDADKRLQQVRPALSKAQRWGLLEGWQSWRPESIDGLILSTAPEGAVDRLRREYNEARSIGRELSLAISTI